MERLEELLTEGLNNEQVTEKIAAGQVNGDAGVKTRSYGQIVRSNLLSLFNLVNVILLVCIIISGSLKNALFFLMVIWNFGIGVFQEIRAKKTIEKLSLISSPKAQVLRDGQLISIPSRDIVLGEIMKLSSGAQICCDCVILKGSCQVNESMLTGESEPVSKKEGDHLLSGSFVSQGSVFACAEHVGSDNYVNRITAAAGSMNKKESVIMHSVKAIVRVVTICIVPLAALLVWNNFFRLDLGFSSAMVKTVAAVSSMIPGGLVLLVSIVLAVSVVRLAVHNTLVQDLYSVEYLARVDTLLLDKTGTITDGKLSVEEILNVADDRENGDALSLLKIYADCTEDSNSTIEAVREYIGAERTADSTAGAAGSLAGGSEYLTDGSAVAAAGNFLCVPFSSERKWGLVHIPERGTLILGAPDRILADERQITDGHCDLMKLVSQYAEKGKRVVMFAFSEQLPAGVTDDGDRFDTALPENITPLALIIIDEKVRPKARETFEFFRKEGVDIKVISGDNPVTVSRIACEAGIENAENYADASDFDEERLAKEASDYTVFGRVKPDQKLQIVRALQEKGHVVAMTGDGANDVLALRASDCSIAMQTGTDAARYAANIVLLDSDFSSMPLIVAEGRKSINNLQRSASLYLTKTSYSFIFAVFFILVTFITYPFENIQVTLIGAVTIGIPSFLLALEPNHERVTGNFLKNVFSAALPAGILEAAALIISSVFLKNQFGADPSQLSTAATYLMLMLGLIAVIRISGRIRLWKIGLILLLAGIAFAAVLLFPSLFSLVTLTGGMWKCILITAAIFTAVYIPISFLLKTLVQRKK